MLRLIALILLAALFAGCAGDADSPPPSGDPLQIPFTLMDGDEVRLADFFGQVILVVNVASKCGFTSQYEGLETLYRRYRDDGLVVLGFPANDFLGQEPGSNEEIQSFCRTEYGVTFPLARKISVKGEDMHPLYRHLCSGLGKQELAGEISWNFNKFLIGRNGTLLARFGSRTAPEDEELVSALSKALSSPRS